jgi:alpha-1,6-mannosyltransferase
MKLALVGIASAALWALGLPAGHGTQAFALRAMGLFALQLAAIALAWKRDDRRTLFVLVGFALLFRALSWTWPPELSSDLHRYLWDGRVQAAGGWA